MIYLASPYSHKSETVMQVRFAKACHAAAELMALGYTVFAPIPHSHSIAAYMDPKLRTDFEFWMSQDLPVLAACEEMTVLVLEGWRESRGVTRELAFANDHNIPIRHYEIGKGFV